jgi:hypothetical protein
MKSPQILFAFVSVILISCGGEYSKQSLTKEDTVRIRRLGLLDTTESIIRYTANYEKEVAGNFYTNKRVAQYWIDERYADRNLINYAYYKDIIRIDTTYNTTSLTQASYLTITKSDASSFKVYITGNKQEVQGFYQEVLNRWQQIKNEKSK